MSHHFKYCSNFLNKYGRIESIKEDWEDVVDLYKNESIPKDDVFNLFTNFLRRYGYYIDTIKEDWEYHKQYL